MIIKNGLIVTANEKYYGDVLVADGKIVATGKNIDAKNHEIIDATGKIVVPGGIDVHTHFNLDVGIATARDDFYTGTVAAACGGTTSIIDHIGFGPADCSLRHQIDVYHGYADNKAVVDYAFHGVFQHLNEDILDEMETLLEEGIRSYKVYLTYGFKMEDDEVLRILKKAKELGIIITVHPENDGAIKVLKEEFLKEGLKSPIYHAKSRPIECEVEAIDKMINLAKIAGDAPLYIVHLSNGLGLKSLKDARDRGQKNIFVETCPQYLFLNEDVYYLPNNEGLKYIIAPPLRTKDNNELLWRGVENKDVDVIATDHCPFYFSSDKMLGANDFSKTPGGAPGVELRMIQLFSEGYKKGRITLNDFVRITSTNPARIFGLSEFKGSIAPGYDADIVIIDPNAKQVVEHKNLHENVDYTPYEGQELEGKIEMVFSRGDLIVKDNNFIGDKGRGKYINRHKPEI